MSVLLDLAGLIALLAGNAGYKLGLFCFNGEDRLIAKPINPNELIALVDRMERRLEVLERALPAEARDEEHLVEAGANDARIGRK